MRDTLKRYRVVKRVSAVLDVILGPLALITLAFLLAELLVQLSYPWNRIVYVGQVAIWVVFLAAFVVELSLAPKKLLYLRRNWILVVSLGIPALRIFRIAQAMRVLRAARFVRSTSVVRSLTTLNRALRSLRGFLGFSQLAFVGVLTAVIWLVAAGLVYTLEAGVQGGITSVGTALWWSATTLTTVGASVEPVTTEGRVVAIGVQVFGVAVFGYLTARLAAFFFGSQRQKEDDDTRNDVRALRREIEELRQELKYPQTDSRT